MVKTNTDFAKMFADMFAGWPTDLNAYTKGFQNFARFNEKLAKVMLDAAEKNTDISARWTKDALAQTRELVRVHDDPADYAKTFNKVASASMEKAAENIAALADVAKKAQVEAVELMMAAGKEAQEEATKVAAKAAKEATEAMTKAAAKATAKAA